MQTSLANRHMTKNSITSKEFRSFDDGFMQKKTKESCHMSI